MSDSSSGMNDNSILVTGGSGFIGAHLVDALMRQDCAVVNLDKAEPSVMGQRSHWVQCNILDAEALNRAFQELQPACVVHLAARTTTDGRSIEDYPDNTTGTANVLNAVKQTASIRRVLITSSQHVRRPGSGLPTRDDDYAAHGAYGESKVVTEQLTRAAGLQCVWTIIRPTTIWGPRHYLLAAGLWRYIRMGLYVHPKDDPVIRSYGYVENTVWQIQKILEAPEESVAGKVIYVGDDLVRQSVWIDAFARALRGRDAVKVPRRLIHGLALVGDAVERFGLRFPMDSPRYFNLTTTNPVPIGAAIATFGLPPYSLEEGIRETVAWLQAYRSAARTQKAAS
jgi:nucleoside-diphosphate-sugar epimerase